VDGEVPVEALAVVVQLVDSNTALVHAAQPEKFVITSMKKLMISTVLYNRYFHNLVCSANWDIQTKSPSGDRSKIVTWIIPCMIKAATEEELRILESPRPDANVDQLQWRLGIQRASEVIELRVKENLLADEIRLGIREEKLGSIDIREMTVHAVETRLQAIQRRKDQKSQPSVSSIFTNSDATSSSATVITANKQNNKKSRSNSNGNQINKKNSKGNKRK
jgi:hypothetical protein